jgi:CHAT domain-containing protein
MTDPLTLQAQIFHWQREAGQRLREFDIERRAGRLAAACAAGVRLSEALDAQVQALDRLAAVAPDAVSPGLHPHAMQLDAWLSRADVAQALGDADEAAALREKGLAVAAALGGAVFAERQRQMAGTWLEEGRPHEALVALRAAHDLALASGAPFQAARCSASLAGAFEDLCDDERALATVRNGLAELAAAGWRAPEQPRPADDIARTVADLLGMLSGAAGSPAPSGGGPVPKVDDVTATAAWCDMVQIEARAARRRGDYAHAARLFAQVRPFILSYAHPALDYQLLMIEVAAGHHARALEMLDDLLPHMQQGALRRKLGQVLLVRGRLLHEAGRPAEALPWLRQAAEEAERFPDLHLAWNCAARESAVLLALGDEDGALAACERAAGVIGWLRRAPLGHRLDSLYLADKLPVLQTGVLLAARLGRAETTHALLEQLKSRQLAATVGVPRGDEASAGSLAGRIAALSQRLAQAEVEGATAEAMAALVAERDALLEQQRIAEPRWRALTEPLPVDLQRVLQALAPADAAALSLYLDDDGSLAALVLWRGQAQVFVQTLAPETLSTLKTLREQTLAGGPETTAGGEWPALESLLPAPAFALLDAARRWCVVPHRELHLLPWPLLLRAGAPLLTRHTVSLMPSLGLIGLPAADPLALAAPGGVQAVGVSAAGWQAIDAAAECDAVTSLYAANGVPAGPPLVEDAASRDALRGLLSAPQAAGSLLHVACHGEMDPQEPMASSLKLADGRFDATEVAQLRCGFDEVVLSACSVGRRGLAAGGLASHGDELLGLVGAFLEAGARRVLVSLTPVRDVAALELMKLFHAERAAGRPAAEALRAAQATLLEEGIFSQDDWGGFVLFAGP